MAINFEDPQIWITIAFITFFVVFGKVIWIKMSGFLDSKIEEIRKEIKEANELHKEAKDLLAAEKKKVQGLEEQVSKIIKESKSLSKEILIKSKEKINDEIVIMEKACQDKINYLEQEALKDIRQRISSRAIELAMKNINKNINEETHNDMIDSSIKEVKKAINKTKAI
tara:strand:- start:1 stop:507 length:507 start_codon:yes stop_codon:yes gene_type:complete